ncbi:HEPN domain-containing protein [Marinomonas transparens]|uniref:HEPN domain-containing protein n=1 Tax=Marinomonas transparens TaxID=2795388 RepID=A0A934JNL6_9GAMM|nr:HEPN domain-containing protein [Marinomonas transparens]MBJ7537763.1 HEPN domain-containing protein [Marinomonas transparens]
MKTTLDHLPEQKQQELQTIVKVFRDTLEDFLLNKEEKKSRYRIFKIILFGSHAKGTWVNDPQNGYVSDYDILVIVNQAAFVEEDEFWYRAKDKIQRRIESVPLGLIVHSFADVSEQLKQGHYFFKDIREQGIELYSNSAKELPMPGNLNNQERRSIAQSHFDQWFSRAADSFKKFHFSRQESMGNEAAFDLHQVTERLFSCALLVCTNYLPKSHDIEKLHHLCAEQDLAFADIFPMNSKFHRRSFRRLQRAYIDARYSEHYEITVEELDYLQSEVAKLQALTKSVCHAHLSEP